MRVRGGEIAVASRAAVPEALQRREGFPQRIPPPLRVEHPERASLLVEPAPDGVGVREARLAGGGVDAAAAVVVEVMRPTHAVFVRGDVYVALVSHLPRSEPFVDVRLGEEAVEVPFVRVAADVRRPALPYVPHERLERNRRDEPAHQLLGVARFRERVAVIDVVLGALVFDDDGLETVAEGVHRAVRGALRGVVVVDLAVEQVAHQTLQVVLAVVARVVVRREVERALRPAPVVDRLVALVLVLVGAGAGRRRGLDLPGGFSRGGGDALALLGLWGHRFPRSRREFVVID